MLKRIEERSAHLVNWKEHWLKEGLEPERQRIGREIALLTRQFENAVPQKFGFGAKSREEAQRIAQQRLEIQQQIQKLNQDLEALGNVALQVESEITFLTQAHALLTALIDLPEGNEQLWQEWERLGQVLQGLTEDTQALFQDDEEAQPAPEPAPVAVAEIAPEPIYSAPDEPFLTDEPRYEAYEEELTFPEPVVEEERELTLAELEELTKPDLEEVVTEAEQVPETQVETKGSRDKVQQLLNRFPDVEAELNEILHSVSQSLYANPDKVVLHSALNQQYQGLKQKFVDELTAKKVIKPERNEKGYALYSRTDAVLLLWIFKHKMSGKLDAKIMATVKAIIDGKISL